MLHTGEARGLASRAGSVQRARLSECIDLSRPGLSVGSCGTVLLLLLQVTRVVLLLGMVELGDRAPPCLALEP